MLEVKHAFRSKLGDRGGLAGPGLFIEFLDEQPILLLLARLAHAHQRPQARELFTLETNLEVALAQALPRIVLRFPRAPVPQNVVALAVLMGGYFAFECAVIERVILDVHGETFIRGIEARPLRDGPALQGAVELEPEVVMQAARVVTLDEIGHALSGLRADLASRFRCDGEIALLPVFHQRLYRGLRAGCAHDLPAFLGEAFWRRVCPAACFDGVSLRTVLPLPVVFFPVVSTLCLSKAMRSMFFACRGISS